ncbi:hypothetical protein D9M70_472430 [compost metagenome]
MVGGAVVALTIVLDRELPISLLDHIGFVRDLGVSDVVGCKAFGHDFDEAIDVFGRIV